VLCEATALDDEPSSSDRRPGFDALADRHPHRSYQQGAAMTKYASDDSNFGADGPFFGIIREGLEGLVDGEDYFDLLADDVVFEYVISVPGYPRRVQGRQNVVELYRGYDDHLRVHSADGLRIHRDREASVVVLEYEVHGESVPTGRPYDNRFVSIITVRDAKVVSWRDYLDPIAVLEATGWPGREGDPPPSR
jgi:ketosteroid isomerase-like protein